MASSYPGGLDNFSTTHADGVQEVIHASAVNDLADATNKIEGELGTNPSGTAATVAARFTPLETLAFTTVSATTYTLILTDAGKVISCSNAGTTSLHVPPQSSVAFPLGTQVMVRLGALGGALNFVGDTGVTLQSRGSSFSLAGPVSWATLVLVNDTANTWDLFGDLA